jgi:hypothetical protein
MSQPHRFFRLTYALGTIALTAAFMLDSAPAMAQEAQKVAAAQTAAQTAALAWLVLADAGDYSRTWDQAAGLFQASISNTTWVGALTNARQPLGAMVSRRLRSAVFKRTLPGAPDGEYVVIQYETRFEHKPSVIETVTPMLDKDGSWKVSGYFIS